VSPNIVVIGPADALPALRTRFDSSAELHAFTDVEALEALDHIIRHKPRIIALDHEFSASPRGVALIDRIHADPSLAHCEVRVIAHETVTASPVVRRTAAAGQHSAVAIDEPESALDHGTRHATRVVVHDGIDILVDGNPASLVDLSATGAQVLCASVLRPNARVRVTMNDSKGTVRCGGVIAWASLELPKDLPPRYRAGIELKAADAAAVIAFAERHRRS